MLLLCIATSKTRTQHLSMRATWFHHLVRFENVSMQYLCPGTINVLMSWLKGCPHICMEQQAKSFACKSVMVFIACSWTSLLRKKLHSKSMIISASFGLSCATSYPRLPWRRVPIGVLKYVHGRVFRIMSAKQTNLFTYFHACLPSKSSSAWMSMSMPFRRFAWSVDQHLRSLCSPLAWGIGLSVLVHFCLDLYYPLVVLFRLDKNLNIFTALFRLGLNFVVNLLLSVLFTVFDTAGRDFASVATSAQMNPTEVWLDSQ